MWTFWWLMRLELWLKDFPYSTPIRSFSSVTSSMLNEVRTVTEGSDPRYTHRPFSSVNSPVLKQCQAMAKWFPTLLTIIRLCPSVNSIVWNEVRFAAKGLSIWLFSSVNFLMFKEVEQAGTHSSHEILNKCELCGVGTGGWRNKEFPIHCTHKAFLQCELLAV